MPTRSRSHQLEAESIRRFEQTLPSRWVCRRKDSDYGVDLEVEIFNDFGEATGLIFLVQLKGTDRSAQARSVSMKVDRLKYLSRLDCPSMVVRYCSADDSLHWKWLSNIFAEISEPNTKTVTVQFGEGDVWSDVGPEAIVHTLKLYRTIRISSRRLPIGLSIDAKGSESPHAFELNYAVAEIVSSCRIVGTSSDPSECLPVIVYIDGEYLRARIDVIASIAVHLNVSNRNEIASQLSYVLAYFASGYEFMSQTRDLVTLIRMRGYRCQSRQVAAVIAARITEHPNLAGDLAALNGIHERQDEPYLIYIDSLLNNTLPFGERLEALSRFYSDALQSHATEAFERQAAIHYSFGNALRISGAMSQAVRQYNLARRKYPDYLRRGYFLAELAASLFFRSHYRIAATLYDHAYEAELKPQFALCAGDAYLLHGQFAEARRCYGNAATSQDIFESSEGVLKDWMTGWAEEFSKHNRIVGGWSMPGLWISVLNQSVDAGQHDHAIGACLMLCYLAEDNLPFWVQVMLRSMGGESHELRFVVIACAVWKHGLAAYALFRDRLLEGGDVSNALRDLDQMVNDLNTQRSSNNHHSVTIRNFREHHYDTVVEIPENPENTKTY